MGHISRLLDLRNFSDFGQKSTCIMISPTIATTDRTLCKKGLCICPFITFNVLDLDFEQIGSSTEPGHNCETPKDGYDLVI